MVVRNSGHDQFVGLGGIAQSLELVGDLGC
jgi:hypothetical protein